MRHSITAIVLFLFAFPTWAGGDYRLQRPILELLQLLDKAHHPTCLYPLLRSHPDARICIGDEPDAIVSDTRSSPIPPIAQYGRFGTPLNATYTHPQAAHCYMGASVVIGGSPSGIFLRAHFSCALDEAGNRASYSLMSPGWWEDGVPQRADQHVYIHHRDIRSFSMAWNETHQRQSLSIADAKVFVRREDDTGDGVRWTFHVEQCYADGRGCTYTEL